MRIRMKVGLLAATLCVNAAAGWANAQPSPLNDGNHNVRTFTPGVCQLTIMAVTSRCEGVVYLEVVSASRESLSVATPNGNAVTFSGLESSYTDDAYTIVVDSVLYAGGPGEAKRNAAQGRCIIQQRADSRIVHSLTCTARSGAGQSMSLRFSGTADQ